MAHKNQSPKTQRAKLQSQISGKVIEVELLAAELTHASRNANIPMLVDAGELGMRQERSRITGLASEDGKPVRAMEIARDVRNYVITGANCLSCGNEVEEAVMPALEMVYDLKCSCNSSPTPHNIRLEEKL